MAATARVFLLLFGIVSSNLLPGDKRLGHNHHHHHHQEHHHHQSPHDQHHGEDHHHNEEPEHHHHHSEDGERSGKSLADIDFTAATLDEETGLKCVRTEETLETLEREKLLSCTHSSINICHYTYVTKFSPFQPRVCEDVYSKQCNIVFSRRAEETTEQHCYRPWTRRCGLQGEEGEGGEETQCRRVSDSWCVTRWQAGKGTALTSCNKIPQTLCSPANCQIVQEEEKCHNKSVTVVNEVPDESCDIIPSKICRNINKLVPHLEPVEECKDQPRQVCSYGLKSPSLREKPLITKWCYNDNDAAGIFGEKDRKPKSDIFKTENIPSSLLISTNPLVPPIHNALIDDETNRASARQVKRPSQPETEDNLAVLDEDVSDRGRARLRPNKIFGNKLISQSLLPPAPSGPTRTKASHHENSPGESEKPLAPSGGAAGDDQNLIINDTQSDDDELPADEQFDEFIDTFLDTVKQDPENFVPGQETDDDVDTNVIDEVFEFDEQKKKASSKSQLSISKELRPDDTPIAKVLKHDNEGSVSKTIIIQNNPTAHKIFGVKNPPRKFSPEFLSSLTSLSRDMKDIGQRKSKSGAKPISRDHNDDTQHFLSAQKVRAGFSFGISDITEEERDQYGSAGSAEFHFKSDWNNKAPPPGLVLFRAREETSSDNGFHHHQSADDTNSHNNDQHNPHQLEPPGLDQNLETAFRNPKFNANQFFFPSTSSSSQEIQDSQRKNPNLDLGLIVSQENKLPKSNSFKTFPLIQDNSASSFPRIPDSSIGVHNNEHNRLTLDSFGGGGYNNHNEVDVVDTTGVGGKINDLDLKSSRLQSQDDDGDDYSGGQRVSDGDNVILLLHDEAGKESPTSQYEEVIISPHLGIQSESGTNPNSISNNRPMKNSASTVADYDRSPSSRQHLPTKQKYFPTKEMDAIAGLSEINSGHQQYPQNPQPVGNAISVENLKSIDTSSTGYGPVNPPRPTPGPTGSDKFRPPSTFLYGFKPMTTTESVALSGSSRPINYYPVSPAAPQVESGTPVRYKPAYKPRRKPKNFVLEAISSLLEPITQTLTNLLRG